MNFSFSERTGSIAYIDAGGSLTRQLVNFSCPLSSAAEAGFLGFVLKEDFSESNEAYAYYVDEEQGQSFNRIVLISLEDGSWNEKEILLDEIQTGNVHHGGRLALNDDGVLYATIGDASNPDLTQDRTPSMERYSEYLTQASLKSTHLTTQSAGNCVV